MEKRNAAPITTESFLAFVGSSFGRDLSEKEIRGLSGLSRKHTPETVQGYFLDVLARAQRDELSLEDYLTAGRKKPLSIQSKISQLISADELPIRRADEQDRFMRHIMEREQGHPDYRDYPDGRHPGE